MNGSLYIFFSIAVKFAYLNGDVSEPSDSNGIAVFQNLTVLQLYEQLIKINSLKR